MTTSVTVKPDLEIIVEQYKNCTMEIHPIIINPNGRYTQTVIIYKDGQPVGGCYADIEFEDAVAKAKAKILKRFI